jgi:hypothetical protein
MGPRHRLLPSPAMIVAGIALITALGGTAAALSGKDTVAHNDLKNNVVHTAEIKQGQVKSSDVENGTVTGADLAEPEAFRRVGADGEPPFSDGGDGDCEWKLIGTEIPGINPAAFYKDPYGVVHLVGAVAADGDTGGDTFCNSTEPGQVEDAIVFTLPAGYRPENTTVVGAANSEAFVVGDEDASLAGETIPAGSVLALDEEQVIIDGASFRAAGTGTEPIDLSELQRASLDRLFRQASR